MTKITPDHLARSAFVYVRQSTPISCCTITRAAAASTPSPSAHEQLGWTDVVVIDDDLGRSGFGDRPTRLREAAGCDLRRPCRCRVRD